MTAINRKIHVIGINSYIFEDLPSKLQELFLKTGNIAVPNSYFKEIKSWSENDLEKKRNKIDGNRNTQEELEKKKRVEEFRKRMNKYKETFLDDLDAEKERLKQDMRDEEDFHRRYGRQFGEVDENWPEHLEQPGDFDHFMNGPGGGMESRPRKMRKKKINPLNGLRGVDWDPYDETLKSHGFDYRADEPPDDEEE